MSDASGCLKTFQVSGLSLPDWDRRGFKLLEDVSVLQVFISGKTG
jgi:hypothetical protein